MVLWCACEAPWLGWGLALCRRDEPGLESEHQRNCGKSQESLGRSSFLPDPQAVIATKASPTQSIHSVFPPPHYAHEDTPWLHPHTFLSQILNGVFLSFLHAASPSWSPSPRHESSHSLFPWVMFWVGLSCVLQCLCVSSACVIR